MGEEADKSRSIVRLCPSGVHHFCMSPQRGYCRHLGICNKKKENNAGSGRPCRSHRMAESLRLEKTTKTNGSNRQLVPTVPELRPSAPRLPPTAARAPELRAARRGGRRGARGLRARRSRRALTAPLPGNAERRQTALSLPQHRSAPPLPGRTAVTPATTRAGAT